MASLVKTFCSSFKQLVVLGNERSYMGTSNVLIVIYLVAQFLYLYLQVVMDQLTRIKVKELKNMTTTTTIVNPPISLLHTLNKYEMLLWASKHQVDPSILHWDEKHSLTNIVIETQDSSITLSDNLISESLTPLVNDSELFSALFPSLSQPTGQQSSDQVRQFASSQEFQRALSTLRVACENGELNTVASEIGLGSSAHNSKF